MAPLIYFDASTSPDVAYHEAEIWERHIIEVVCTPAQPPPCHGTSVPSMVSWAIVPSSHPGFDLELWAIDVAAGSVAMFRIRAVDHAGNQSAWETEVGIGKK